MAKDLTLFSDVVALKKKHLAAKEAYREYFRKLTKLHQAQVDAEQAYYRALNHAHETADKE